MHPFESWVSLRHGDVETPMVTCWMEQLLCDLRSACRNIDRGEAAVSENQHQHSLLEDSPPLAAPAIDFVGATAS